MEGKARKKAVWLVVLILFTFVLPVSSYAEGTDGKPSENTSVSQPTVTASPGSVNTTFDPNTPISGGKVSSFFDKLKKDLANFGNSMAIPAFIWGVIVSCISMVLGFFSKKFLHAGLGGLAISFLILFLLGDVDKLSHVGSEIASTIRSYMD